VKRREFITLLGGAAAWPLAARAQQAAMPVIGYVNSGTAGANVKNIAAFRAGLTEAGFVEGQNVAIEFRWAENQFDRLPALVTGLINRPAAVIVGNTLAALRAKAATRTIVFTTGSDPVRDGLVTSLARPGGNVTGVVFITSELGSKQLELLRQFIPKARTIAMLVNPNTPETEAERKEIQVAAQKMGLSLIILDVTSGGDIEAAFATLATRGADTLLVGTGTFTFNSREQIVSLAARQAIPAMYTTREYANAGGLMAYGSSVTGAYRQASLYVGRILKGAKPANLPIVPRNTILSSTSRPPKHSASPSRPCCSPAPTR
jgi:putative tryptophan/tyrosine transport system substrate-binding protein